MKAALIAAAAFAGLTLAPSPVHAYPQFQLTYAPTCSSCHYSPSGGGLLAEMGRIAAEDLTGDESPNSEFMYGKVPLPDWLELGGDLRLGTGLNYREGYEKSVDPLIIPMQADLYARVARDAFSLNLQGGLRGVSARDSLLDEEPPGGPRAISYLVSREHYAMWKPGDEGAYARVGKFLPVFGLRLAEHTAYTRRYGQTPLYGEAYGVGGGWVTAGLEVHATAFIHDRWRSTEIGDGGALYAEKRLRDGKAAVGLGARYANSLDEARASGGATGKLWLEGSKLLLQGELQMTRQTFEDAGGSRNQLVGYLLGSWIFKTSWMLDLGVGAVDEDLAVATNGKQAFDANLHWFPWAHWEFVYSIRAQTIGLGAGGGNSGYALLQAHYRL